jgi:hypothetical protein
VKFFPDDLVEPQSPKKKKRVHLGCLDTKRTRYDRNPRVPDRNDRQFCRNLGCFPSNFADNFSIVPEFAPKSNLQADGYME